jgi:serine/threonine protein kinase
MVGEFANQPFYVREFVEGDTLECKAATWASNLGTALAIVAQLAGAVEWVHQQGFVHGNVSAANVVIDAEGQPRLIGFGRVRLISGAQPIPIDDIGTTCAVDVEGLRELLRSICAALGHRVPEDLEQAIASGALMTAEAFAAAVGDDSLARHSSR